MALSPDGSHAAYEGANGPIVVQALTNRQVTTEFPLASHRPRFLNFSPDGRWLAAIDETGTSWIWDTQSNRLLRSFPKPSVGPVTSLTFSADGKMISRSEKNLQIWGVDPWEQLHFFESPRLAAGTRLESFALDMFKKDNDDSPGAFARTPPTGPAAFSPDSQYVAVINSAAGLNTTEGKPDMEIRVFSLETGELVSTIDWPDLINDLRFSPDGKFIGTAGTGVEMWDWHSGQPARLHTQ